MKSSSKFIILIQFLFIISVTSRNNDYFGYIKVEGERSSTKLYSVSPMEARFKNIVEKFANKRSEQVSKNDILRTIQLKKAEREIKDLHSITKETFNKMDRAFDEFERLRSEDEISKVLENSKHLSLAILEKENQNLEKIFNEVYNNSTDNIIKNFFNATAKAEELTTLMMTYGELANNSSLILNNGHQIDNATRMRLDLSDALISNIFEYHNLLDTFSEVDHFKTVFNETLLKWEKLQNKTKNINKDLFNKLSNFSNLNFNDIEPKRGELLHDINDPNFNEEKLAKTLVDKMIRNIKEELMSNVKWVTIYEKTVLLPDNAVEGGHDDENNKYYVIRKELNHKYYYGKYIRADTRKNAYITTDQDEEKGQENFEILTSSEHIWCKYDKSKRDSYMALPVCRAEYFGSLIPGTLEKNGNCRFSLGGEVERITDGQFEVLQIYEC